MKKLIAILFATLGMLVTSIGTASAYQNASKVRVTDYRMDHARRLCTVQIAETHAVTTQTATCRRQVFTWSCLPNDYRFELAQQSYKSGRGINLRYSEYHCHASGNMSLLTAW